MLNTQQSEGVPRSSYTDLQSMLEEKTAELAKAYKLLEMQKEKLQLAEDALKAERERFHAIMEMLPCYLVVLSPDYKVSYTNREYRKRFGKSTEERCYEHYFGLSAPCNNCNSYTVLKNGSPHIWEWNGPNDRYYLVFDYPFTDIDGEKKILEIGVDITERHNAEDKIQQLNRELEQRVEERTAQLTRTNQALRNSEERYRTLSKKLEDINRKKDDFLALLAHEIRNPLTAILISLQLLEKAPPRGAQVKRALSIINHQTNHLVNLADDLLDINRVTQNRIELRRKIVDLNELTRRATEDHIPIFEKRDILVTAELPSFEIPVYADETRITQIIGNLLQNAAKFTDIGGSILVSVKCDALRKQAFIEVIDNGIGISPDFLTRIFQPFAQADISFARSNGGFGLGLALCKSLVELHGGSISAYSEGLGKGSKFTITLPLASEVFEKQQHSFLLSSSSVPSLQSLRK